MDETGQQGASLVLYFGMFGMFFLAMAIVGFVLIYKRRITKQQLENQLQKIEHQEQLLRSSVKIQDEERKRFAADLHDDIGVGISTVLLAVEKLKRESKNDDNLQDQVKQIRTQLDALLQRTRDISYNIMPPELESFGLAAALSSLCYKINESGSLKVNYEWVGGEDRMDLSVELAIYRIAKELFANVIKHASAENIWIEVEQSKECFIMNVRDDGIGFKMENIKRGAGIRNIKDRALIIGAALEFVSVEGEGTKCRLNKQF